MVRDFTLEKCWRERIEECRQSGLSIKAWCMKHGLKDPDFQSLKVWSFFSLRYLFHRLLIIYDNMDQGICTFEAILKNMTDTQSISSDIKKLSNPHE